MYNKTYEEIKNRILNDMKIDVDKREGTFINDMISPIAVELTKTYMEFNNILNIAFVKNSYDEYLDLKVNEFGVFRKEGEKSQGYINVKGIAGTVIPSGSVALTHDGLRFILEEGTLENGVARIKAVAEEEGKVYNIIENSINKLDIDFHGIEEISNSEEFSGGIDREKDEELKERFFKIVRRPQTSGNKYHYEQWCLEVKGVSNAVVKPLWNGAGTVKVLITDSNKQPVTQDILEACRSHIEEQRPIGASVTVETPALFNLNVEVVLKLDGSKTLEELEILIKDEILKYFKTVENEIIFSKIGGIISNIPSVIDYKDLKLNGSTTNLSHTDEEVAFLESLVINLWP